MNIKGFSRFNNGGNNVIHRKDLNNNTTWILSDVNGDELRNRTQTVNAILVSTIDYENGIADIGSIIEFKELENVGIAENYFN